MSSRTSLILSFPNNTATPPIIIPKPKTRVEAPHGNTNVGWLTSVKPYAKTLIPNKITIVPASILAIHFFFIIILLNYTFFVLARHLSMRVAGKLLAVNLAGSSLRHARPYLWWHDA